jgi:hypothetical protein
MLLSRQVVEQVGPQQYEMVHRRDQSGRQQPLANDECAFSFALQQIAGISSATTV